jgi:hypothetical protein
VPDLGAIAAHKRKAGMPMLNPQKSCKGARARLGFHPSSLGGLGKIMAQALSSLLPRLANNDRELLRRGRFLDVTFLLTVGNTDYLVRIQQGRIEAMEKGPLVEPRWTFALAASAAAWRTFWQPVPPPGAHDLIAMLKTGALRLAGDQHPFMANLRYFKELLALPRARMEEP